MDDIVRAVVMVFLAQSPGSITPANLLIGVGVCVPLTRGARSCIDRFLADGVRLGLFRCTDGDPPLWMLVHGIEEVWAATIVNELTVNEL